MPLIEVGRSTPAFSLRDQQNKAHDIRDYRGRIVVLYFYPRDSKATDTNQACQFRDHFAEFTKIKATVIGVGPASIESHSRFAAEHVLPFPLLSDAPGHDGVPAICDLFGAWPRHRDPRANGLEFPGLIRTTYLIDREGLIVRRWDHVRVRRHALDVLETAKMVTMALRNGDGRLAREPEGKARRPRSRYGKVTRTSDSDPPYTPIRGPGNKSTRGPSNRPPDARVPKVRAKPGPRA